jgi:hypothetical protein
MSLIGLNALLGNGCCHVNPFDCIVRLGSCWDFLAIVFSFYCFGRVCASCLAFGPSTPCIFPTRVGRVPLVLNSCSSFAFIYNILSFQKKKKQNCLYI